MKRDKSIIIKNIYYMLSYAFTTLRESTYEEVEKETFDNIHNLFAAILSKGIALQLKQGLYREYMNRIEELSVVRGKIDMQGTIRNRLQRRQVVTCDYDELSENNLLNQVLKSTVYLLYREKDVDDQYKSELKKEMLFFSGIDLINLQHVKWSDIHFQRNNRTYRMLLAICRLLVEGSLLTTESGEYRLAKYVDEQRMCRLYEKFILEYYAQEFGQRFRGFSSQALQIPWILDYGTKALLPVMQTDITLSYGHQILIIDAKYYQRILQSNYDAQTLHSGNMYQIFTYVKNKEAQISGTGYRVSGMLLYAKTDEDIVPDNDYHMSGNMISVKTLDLSVPFPAIKKQLNRIVTDYFGIELNGESVGSDSEKRLHEYAVHLCSLYASPDTSEREVEAGFAEECKKFGFKIDGGHGFIAEYSRAAFNDSRELRRITDQIKDVFLLGSAIYSKWAFVEQWTDTRLLDEENRQWFLIALDRLSELTASSTGYDDPDRGWKTYRASGKVTEQISGKIYKQQTIGKSDDR